MTKIPAFTADASLSRSGRHYCTKGIENANSSYVVPQLAKGDGDDGDGVALLCFWMDVCCAFTGDRRCCTGSDLCDIILDDSVLA